MDISGNTQKVREPMKSVFEKIIEKLEEEKMSYFLTIANTGDEKLDYAYEQVGYALDKAIEIVKQEAEQCEECYKDCGDCEAYNKEKYHCPKFCKVIKETVKEIEENHNGWISCSERLPKYGEVVMCSCTNSGITISCITHKGVKPSKSVRFGQHSVIAWQPLPEPYRSKGE